MKRTWLKRKPPKKKRKVIDHKSRKYLHKKAWDLFSKYVRQKENGVCFTCKKRDNWKNMQAGHFI
ncbi:hypothetical protein, partial [Bifidobacterium pullorum]|uniref:hypothetical protein n=1 Tax=Bifidobacterium pullorum TaxID=78448 RepID=UPI0019580DCE